MSDRQSSLRVEQLERRDTPAAFGTPWPDGRHLTLSLAPDPTPVGDRAGDLGRLLDGLGPAARLEALRAFQTWAVAADVNFGLVADGGQPFGAAGAVQGDPRFGDIRLGGRPLPADVLAVTAPYALHDQNAGNVVVNTAAPFGPEGYDLFTALLQEAGHALGVGNSPDPESAMFEYYGRPRAGLSAGDVDAVRALYGPRVADPHEGPGGNDTPDAGGWYWRPVEADLGTPADVDNYRVLAGPFNAGVTVRLTAAGLSLVTARVELVDRSGAVVAAAEATDPTANDVTLRAGRLRPGEAYAVRVLAARPDVFGVGAYELEVTQHSFLAPATGLLGAAMGAAGDLLGGVTDLVTTAAAVGPRTEYQARGEFRSAGDADVYRLTVPPAVTGGPVALLATVWGRAGARLSPWVEAADAFGNPLPAEVVVADGGTTTVQVRGLTHGGTYFLRLTSDDGAVGGYTLAADLRETPVGFDLGASGTVGADLPARAATLNVAQSGQVQFVLSAAGPAGAGAVLTVRAADGREVARVAAPAGRGRSVAVWLPAGAYRVEVSGTGPAVDFAARVKFVTDPVGARADDPTGSPEGGTSPPPNGTSPPPPPAPPPPADDGGGAGWWADDPGDGTYWY